MFNYLSQHPFCNELFHLFPTLNLVSLAEDLPEPQANKKNIGIVAYKIRKQYAQFSTDLPSMKHEIAHIVEMKDFSRLLQDDFGFTNDIEILTTPGFFSAFAREARVRGIQSHMENRKGFENVYWFGEASSRLPFGKFKSLKEIEEWINTIFTHTRKAWSQDRIRTEWIKRVEFILDWQETKLAA